MHLWFDYWTKWKEKFKNEHKFFSKAKFFGLWLNAYKVEPHKDKKKLPLRAPLFVPDYTRPRNILGYSGLLCPGFLKIQNIWLAGIGLLMYQPQGKNLTKENVSGLFSHLLSRYIWLNGLSEENTCSGMLACKLAVPVLLKCASLLRSVFILSLLTQSHGYGVSKDNPR